MSDIATYIGIDPGKNGAVAVIDVDSVTDITRSVAVHPLAKMTERDICDLFDKLRTGLYSRALIERVSAMPGQGVSSTFKFGVSYGFLRACIVGAMIPFEEVSPQQWQRAMGCLSGGDKNVTKQKAQQLFPQIKITHHVADALLIAEHCRRQIAMTYTS